MAAVDVEERLPDRDDARDDEERGERVTSGGDAAARDRHDREPRAREHRGVEDLVDRELPARVAAAQVRREPPEVAELLPDPAGERERMRADPRARLVA